MAANASMAPKTFDMRDGPKVAKQPLGRPLDGGVRWHHRPQKQVWLEAHLLLDSCAKVMRQPSWNLRHSAE